MTGSEHYPGSAPGGHRVGWFAPDRPVEGVTVHVRPDAVDPAHLAECERRLRATEPYGYATGSVDMSDLHVVLAEYDRRAAAEQKLRAHILDIDAHATPYGDLPDDPGYVGTYLITAGCLHRALGTIGYTSASCTAEAERDELRDAVLALAADLDRGVPLRVFSSVVAARIRAAVGAPSTTQEEDRG